MTYHDVRGGIGGRRCRKIMEWTRRYLPCEIAGWVGELAGATVAYWLTGSLAVAAVVATVGSSVGYYIPAYVNAVRWSCAERRDSWGARVVAANLLALRSLTVEFGIAEVIDSFLVRPLLYYATPVLLGHVVWGWVLGGFVADIVFYAFTIFSYERFGRWLAHPPAVDRAPAAEALPEPVAA
jgi:uncharacterized membrane protein